jgi:hypothetical protein
MTISLRLERDIELELELAARSAGASKSALVRSLISDYLKKKTERLTPWETGKEVFGRYGSGSATRSVDRKAILKDKLRAQRRSH